MSCDDRLMRERAADIVDGVAIMLYAVQASRALIAIEDNKPEAIQAMRAACSSDARIAGAESADPLSRGFRQTVDSMADRPGNARRRARH